MTNEQSSKVDSFLWWKRLGSTLLLGYFGFTIWTWIKLENQAIPWMIRAFVIAIVLLYGLEKLVYRGREGEGAQTNAGLRYLIFLTWFVMLLSCALFHLLNPVENKLISLVGVVIIGLGIFIRIWGVYTLGTFFSTYLETWEDHQVVQNGPYHWIRHPAYAGSILIGFGFPLMMVTGWVLVLSVFFCVLVVRRIILEEQFLHEKIPGYAAYRLKTHRLIPGIW